jgi:hypothetical protein
VSAPASPGLRWIAAILRFAAAGLSGALPFVSATLLTIGIGLAFSAVNLLTAPAPGDG